MVEVLWKIVIGVLNLCLMAMIHFYDSLHGFGTSIGTETASLEANMLQHIMALREEVLYEILLDIHKSYEYLYRDRFLDILEAYGVVPWTLRLLRQYWSRLMMVAWAGGYFDTPFKGCRGVTQGGGGAVSHNIQCGRRCGPLTLGHRGDINGGGSGSWFVRQKRFWSVCSTSHSILI